MPITFEKDNNVIVYAFEKIIAFCWDNQYIYIAQCIWWISSVVRLQQGITIHIDNTWLWGSTIAEDILSVAVSYENGKIYTDQIGHFRDSVDKSDNESNRLDSVLKTTEELLNLSKRQRNNFQKTKWELSNGVENAWEITKTYQTQTDGMEDSELNRRKAAKDCQCCAWPRYIESSHNTLDCFCWKRLEKGTAPFLKQRK